MLWTSKALRILALVSLSVLLAASSACASRPADSPGTATDSPLLNSTVAPSIVPIPTSQPSPGSGTAPSTTPLPTGTLEPVGIASTPVPANSANDQRGGTPASDTSQRNPVSLEGYAVACGDVLREASVLAGDAELNEFEPMLVSELLEDLSSLSPPHHLEYYQDSLLALVTEARDAGPSVPHAGFESEAKYLAAVIHLGRDENEVLLEQGCLDMSGIVGKMLLDDACVEMPSDYDVSEYIVAEGTATRYRAIEASDVGDRNMWYWGSESPQSETIVTFDHESGYGQLNNHYFRNAAPGGGWSKWAEMPPERLTPPSDPPAYQFCGYSRYWLGSLKRRGEEILDGRLVTRFGAHFRSPLASEEQATGSVEIWVDGEGSMVREIVESFTEELTLRRDYSGWGDPNHVASPFLEGAGHAQATPGPSTEGMSQDTEQIPLEIIDTGPGTLFVSPELLGLLYRFAGGDSVLTAVSVVVLDVDFRPVNENTDLGELMVNGGGTVEEGGVWRLPVGMVAKVIQEAQVARVVIPDDLTPTTEQASTRNVHGALGNVVRAYEAGVPEAQAALYASIVDGNRVFVEIWARDASTALAVRAWLWKKEIIFPSRSLGEHGDPENFSLVGLLPVGLIAPLASTFPSVGLKSSDFFSESLPLSRHWWPEEILEYAWEATQSIIDAQQSAREAIRD